MEMSAHHTKVANQIRKNLQTEYGELESFIVFSKEFNRVVISGPIFDLPPDNKRLRNHRSYGWDRDCKNTDLKQYLRIPVKIQLKKPHLTNGR